MQLFRKNVQLPSFLVETVFIECLEIYIYIELVFDPFCQMPPDYKCKKIFMSTVSTHRMPSYLLIIIIIMIIMLVSEANK